MGAGARPDLTYLNMVVMKDSFDAGMRMLSDMARHPAFAPAEIDRQRQQVLSGLKVSLEDPDYVADAVFDRLVYGFHPYGMPQTGTPETVNGITRDDIVAFHKKYFAPNNAILAVVGDVTAEEAFDTVRKVFGDWERKEIPAEKFIEPPAPTRRLIVVNKPDAVQTEVRVGHVGIARKHPDYMAINLAIRILGGEGSNRLHNVLRTQRGLTYGAQADMDTLKESGDFLARTNTRSAATAEVVRVIFDEFWRLQRDPVGERELADAKAYMTGSFPLTIETPDAIAMQVLNVVFYGLPIEDLQSFRERVNAVTVADIQRVARAYLQPDRLSVVLVGNLAAFEKDLKGVGFTNYERVELANLDLTTADFKRAAGRVGAAAQPRLRPIAYQEPPRGQAPRDHAPGRRRRARPARSGDRREGRPRDVARDQEHHGDHQDLDDRGRPCRPTRRPTWSIPATCGSRRRCRACPRSRSSTASSAGFAIRKACTTSRRRPARPANHAAARHDLAAARRRARRVCAPACSPTSRTTTGRGITRSRCRAPISIRSCCTSTLTPA